MFKSFSLASGMDRLITWGGGVFIYFMFTDLNNNLFQNKLIVQNTNI